MDSTGHIPGAMRSSRDDERAVVVSVSLLPEEHKALTDGARAVGVSRSLFASNLIMLAAERVPLGAVAPSGSRKGAKISKPSGEPRAIYMLSFKPAVREALGRVAAHRGLAKSATLAALLRER